MLLGNLSWAVLQLFVRVGCWCGRWYRPEILRSLPNADAQTKGALHSFCTWLLRWVFTHVWLITMAMGNENDRPILKCSLTPISRVSPRSSPQSFLPVSKLWSPCIHILSPSTLYCSQFGPQMPFPLVSWIIPTYVLRTTYATAQAICWSECFLGWRLHIPS